MLDTCRSLVPQAVIVQQHLVDPFSCPMEIELVHCEIVIDNSNTVPLSFHPVLHHLNIEEVEL
jgi:hypothetical protein